MSNNDNELRDEDYPTEKCYPGRFNHPKVRLLKELVQANYEEYQRAAQKSAIIHNGRVVCRSKVDIVTEMIATLMPEGARFMEKSKEGIWVVKPRYTRKELRRIVTGKIANKKQVAKKKESRLCDRTNRQGPARRALALAVQRRVSSVVNRDVENPQDGATLQKANSVALNHAAAQPSKQITLPVSTQAAVLPSRQSTARSLNQEAAVPPKQGASPGLNQGTDLPTEQSTSRASSVDTFSFQLSLMSIDTLSTSEEYLRPVLDHGGTVTENPVAAVAEACETWRDVDITNDSMAATIPDENIEDGTASNEGKDKRVRSVHKTHSRERQSRRRVANTRRDTTQTHSRGGSSSDSFVSMISTRLSGSVLSGQEASTFSSMSRSQSETSLARLRGGDDAPTDVADSKVQILQLSKQVKDTFSQAKRTRACDRNSGSNSVVGQDVGVALEQDDMSSLSSGVRRAGSASIQRILTTLSNLSLNLKDTQRLLDELTDRAINEDRELMGNDVTSRAVEIVSEVMQRNYNDENVQFRACSFIGQIYDTFDSFQVSDTVIEHALRVMHLCSHSIKLLDRCWRLLRVAANCDPDARILIGRDTEIDYILKCIALFISS